MRLKEDDSSWKSSGIRRRDARRQKPNQEVEKPRSKVKDTKKWCRGKVGKKHDLIWTKNTQFVHSSWWDQKCSRCGKKTDFWCEGSWFSKRPTPPSLIKQWEKEGIF